MLLNLLAAVCAQELRLPVTYGTIVQLRNIGTSLHLASGPRNSMQTSPWDFFGTFTPTNEDWYWTVNHIEMSHNPELLVKCGSLIRLTPVDQKMNLAVETFFTARSLVGVADAVDNAGFWNVSCDGAVWGFNMPVQFKNIGKGCFLAARIDRTAHPTITNRYPLECATISSDNSVWMADAGVFCQDDLEDPAYQK
jgi:hypothetical protein